MIFPESLPFHAWQIRCLVWLCGCHRFRHTLPLEEVLFRPWTETSSLLAPSASVSRKDCSRQVSLVTELADSTALLSRTTCTKCDVHACKELYAASRPSGGTKFRWFTTLLSRTTRKCDVCIRKVTCTPCRAVKWHEVSLVHGTFPRTT